MNSVNIEIEEGGTLLPVPENELDSPPEKEKTFNPVLCLFFFFFLLILLLIFFETL